VIAKDPDPDLLAKQSHLAWLKSADLPATLPLSYLRKTQAEVDIER
jgi:hypothetical protein